MIRWIRGQLEASYVGEPSKLVLPAADKNARRFQLKLLRAAVREVSPIAAPADARPPIEQPANSEAATASPAPAASAVGVASAADASGEPLEPFVQVPSFRQARVDDAHVAELRGSGSYFVGALFDLRVSDVELSFPAEKNGRAYGRMTGTVVACLVLPPEPAPQRAPESVLSEEPPLLTKGELHVAAETVDEDPAALEEAPPVPPEERASENLLPALALAAVVCLALALQCGALPALLWALFMLPTLVARRLFTGMLPDTRGMQLVGAVLVLVQLACTATLLTRWWSADCRELAVLPLLGVIATLFPAGLLPSRIPLVCNALSLAVILFGWCTSLDGACASAYRDPGTTYESSGPTAESRAAS